MASWVPPLSTVQATTRLYCVLGHPVSHSLSPAMHNGALAALGIDGVYLAFDVTPEALDTALAGLLKLGAIGANLTIPHKEAAVNLMDELSAEARRIGAVNTVCFSGDRMRGENTDGRGFLDALASAGLQTTGRAMILGAGGSARAIACALAGKGMKLTIANRRVDRAAGLAAWVDSEFGRGAARSIGIGDPSLCDELENSALLVNTTPVGMSSHAGEATILPPEALGEHLFVYDLVYSPAETPLLAAARARGCRVENGLSMLAHQGALSLQHWTGTSAPVNLMASLARKALAGPQSEEGPAGKGAEP